MSEAQLDLSPDALMAAKVNPSSGLATDYLNVFNEPLMLLGLAGDDAMMLEELADWSAPDYPTHFTHSGFAAKDVIIAAYHAAPEEVRTRFDRAAAELANDIRNAVARAAGVDDPQRGPMLEAMLVDLQSQVSRLDAIIHGGLPRDRAGADADYGSAADAINALFD